MITRVFLTWWLSWTIGSAQPLWTGEPSAPRPALPGRARVVIVEDPRSVIAYNPVPAVVAEMVRLGIATLAGKEDSAQAWRTWIDTQDTVGIKVYSTPGATSGTRPSVVAAVVESLLAAGVPSKQIVIWDKHLADLRKAGFVQLADRYRVTAAGSADTGYDEKIYYEAALLGNLVWGDFEFGQKGEQVGRKSFVSKLLTQRLTKIIHITPLLNHNLTYVSGNLAGLTLGSVDNTLRFETVANPGVPLSQAIPEIYALPEIGDRVVVNIVDALICQYQGAEHTLLHYSTILNQLRFSTDPVALDVLSIHELDRQRRIASIHPVKINWQIYSNAALLELGISDTRLIDVDKINGSDNTKLSESR